MRAARKAAHAVMATCFALSAALQLNDPDPLPWTTIYAAALVACVLAFMELKKAWTVAALAGFVALGWAIALYRTMPGLVPAGDLFTTAGMKTQAIEESREVLGLSIVVAWMAVLIVTDLRRGPGSS
jgi:hypothetical protein